MKVASGGGEYIGQQVSAFPVRRDEGGEEGKLCRDLIHIFLTHPRISDTRNIKAQ
jgi:hypothetical protein